MQPFILEFRWEKHAGTMDTSAKLAMLSVLRLCGSTRPQVHVWGPTTTYRIHKNQEEPATVGTKAGPCLHVYATWVLFCFVRNLWSLCRNPEHDPEPAIRENRQGLWVEGRDHKGSLTSDPEARSTLTIWSDDLKLREDVVCCQTNNAGQDLDVSLQKSLQNSSHSSSPWLSENWFNEGLDHHRFSSPLGNLETKSSFRTQQRWCEEPWETEGSCSEV